MKRGRELTGGTGDVNPQFLSFTATQSAADTTTSIQVALPVQRLQNRNMAQVMEVLKVFWNTSTPPAIAAVGESLDSITAVLSTVSFGTTNAVFSDPRVIALTNVAQRGAFTAGGTYVNSYETRPFVQDLTDGAGHGVLVATDSLFMQVQSATTGNANIAQCKVLYRMKNVSMTEYVGIVQSQQAPTQT